METKKQIAINFIKKYSKKKRAWVLLILAIVFLSYLLGGKGTTETIVVDSVKYINLKQTVLATGQVTSNTDLDLSFNTTGVVKSLKVKVGDVVKKGTILATIDQGAVLASLTQARGALGAAQARLKRTLENEEVRLAQVEYDRAKQTQSTLVDNAYQKLLNSTIEAFPLTGTNDYTAPVISGTYNLGREGVINIKTYLSTNGGSGFNVSGLVMGSGTVATTTAQPIGNSGLFITFSTTRDANVSDWVINIPNKKASNYLTNYNAYQEALATSQSVLDKLSLDLELKKARSTGSDIDLARADVLSAEGQMQAAQSKYEDTIIRAPADGTITNIDVKLGELSEAQKPIITLQDTTNLYVEAKINESNIANLMLGQKVSMTLDAFGPSRTFNGNVVHIDPGATANDGIVNYKIKSSITPLDSAIRAGMNADIAIITAEKPHVLVIPRAAVLYRDTKTYVNVITNSKKKKYKEQEIKIGLTGDGNLIEVKSGLTEGQSIAIISK